MSIKWLYQNILALDQLCNTLLGGFADETLSARTYRNRNTKWRWKVAYKVLNTIFFAEKDHCYNAYLSEVHRRQYAPGSYTDTP